ncbi:MAG: hypothetical protein R2728_16720 [Chitinophagales bacterium]
MKKLLLFTFLTSFGFYLNLDAQVYSTEDLKLKEEKHILEKNQKSGDTTPIPKVEKENFKSPLDANALLNSYKIVRIEAFDYQSKHTELEMKNFQQEMLEEFQTNDMSITHDCSMIYLINRGDHSKYLARAIKIENNKLVYTNCEKCNMEPMTIIEHNNYDLIVEMPAQDGESFYTVRLTFKR